MQASGSSSSSSIHFRQAIDSTQTMSRHNQASGSQAAAHAAANIGQASVAEGDVSNLASATRKILVTIKSNELKLQLDSMNIALSEPESLQESVRVLKDSIDWMMELKLERNDEANTDIDQAVEQLNSLLKGIETLADNHEDEVHSPRLKINEIITALPSILIGFEQTNQDESSVITKLQEITGYIQQVDHALSNDQKLPTLPKLSKQEALQENFSTDSQGRLTVGRGEFGWDPDASVFEAVGVQMYQPSKRPLPKWKPTAATRAATQTPNPNHLNNQVIDSIQSKIQELPVMKKNRGETFKALSAMNKNLNKLKPLINTLEKNHVFHASHSDKYPALKSTVELFKRSLSTINQHFDSYKGEYEDKKADKKFDRVQKAKNMQEITQRIVDLLNRLPDYPVPGTLSQLNTTFGEMSNKGPMSPQAQITNLARTIY